MSRLCTLVLFALAWPCFSADFYLQQEALKDRSTLEFLGHSDQEVSNKSLLVEFRDPQKPGTVSVLALSSFDLGIMAKYRYMLYRPGIEDIKLECDPDVFLIYLHYLYTQEFMDPRKYLAKKGCYEENLEEKFVQIYRELANLPRKLGSLNDVLEQWQWSNRNAQGSYYLSEAETELVFRKEVMDFLRKNVTEKSLRRVTPQPIKNKRRSRIFSGYKTLRHSLLKAL